MTTAQPIRHTQVWVWILICLLAMFLVLAVLVRVAAADPREPQGEPPATYIVSPTNGTFVAGSYRGAEPYVSIGSKLQPGAIVENVELWGKLRPIRSTVRGTVIEILVFDDALIVPRQLLFKVQLATDTTLS